MSGERSGKSGRVYIGTYVVVNIKSWKMSGLINTIIEHSSLDKEFVQKDYGIGNFGSVEIVGNYDPDDDTGQGVLKSIALNKAKVTNLYFSLDPVGTSKWEPDLTNDSSAVALVSKADAIGFAEDDSADNEFTIELGGKWLLV